MPGSVNLRVWGSTQQDAELAERDGRSWAKDLGHQVAAVQSDIGSPRTIPRLDGRAISQGESYNRAWAAYRAAAGS